MINTLQIRKYLCACGLSASHYVWDDEVENKRFKCRCKQSYGFSNLEIGLKVQAPAIRTPTKTGNESTKTGIYRLHTFGGSLINPYLVSQ